MFSRFMFMLCAAGSATLGVIGALDRIAQWRPAAEAAGLVARAANAHSHLMRGDIKAYRQTIAVAPDFTLMDPFGGRPTGAPRSDEHWERIGRFFRDGRASRFEPIASYESSDLIVLVANEHANVAVGRLHAQDWSLRVTLVFRRDGREWKLVHRHADPLVNGISVEEAARLTLARN